MKAFVHSGLDGSGPCIEVLKHLLKTSSTFSSCAAILLLLNRIVSAASIAQVSMPGTK